MSIDKEPEKQAQRGRLKILELKQRKTRTKTAFTKSKHKLLDSLSVPVESFDSAATHELKAKFDRVYEDAYEAMEVLCIGYNEQDDANGETKTAQEQEILECEYEKTHAAMRKVIDKTSDPARSEPPDLGKDLLKQLKRISIPVFKGDKKRYERWKAAFMSCVDKSPATAEYKLLQLRQYLSGEALKAIENLGHSPAAYDAAKERLERKFGGLRRKINLHLEEIASFPELRDGSPKYLEQFSDLLDLTVINLKEMDKDSDLMDGTLYYVLQKKMTKSMLTKYHRWISENEKDESVQVLREWVVQESMYLSIASETVNGLADKSYTHRKDDRLRNKTNGHELTMFADRAQGGARQEQKLHCKFCNGEHGIWRCEAFKSLKIPARWEKAKELQLCFRCLGDNHTGRECHRTRQCNLDGCKRVHHRLLHKVDLNPQAPPYEPKDNTFTNITPNVYVALRTVPVLICANGRELKVNALLDDGSTKTYINEDVVEELGLRNRSNRFENVKVTTLNGKTENIQTMQVKFHIKSVDRNTEMAMEANTVQKVTGNLKPIDWNKLSNNWAHLRGLPFASIGKRPKVDLLIGLDYTELHKSLGELSGEEGSPSARLTPLGWTCVGQINLGTHEQNDSYFTFHSDSVISEDVGDILRKFWEVETVGQNVKQPLTANEHKVMEFMDKTIEQDETHQIYEVSISWKDSKSELKCSNFAMAKRKLECTERKLQKNPELQKSYSEIIDKYEQKGYISKVDNELAERPRWYLPHFPVVRMDKSTTKVRLVFDASVKYNGVSLNDVIFQGPKLQNELFGVLLRFRKQEVAIISDIQEMYLQIGLFKPDRRYHSFLWRENSDNEPEVYEFNRVVFGVNASPFLAQYVTQQNARKYQSEYPLAAESVIKSTYMDDTMDSVDSIRTGITLYRELCGVWEKAGMRPRKWMSNSEEVLIQIPQEERAFQVDIGKDELPCLRTLELNWVSETDMCTYQYNEPYCDMKLTKRTVLKTIAAIFDPLGLVVPFTVRAKVILQRIWLAGLDWDDELPETLANEVRRCVAEIRDLRQIAVPRCLNVKQNSEIHTFVDASSQAYGTVVYVRNDHGENVSINLATSKSKVAPLKTISIPRLELMAAVLGLTLSKNVCQALNCNIRDVKLWSDSMNVLYWIRNQSKPLKPFIANRLGEIQSQTDPEQWRYIPTKENPADLTTRGETVSKLADNSFWWEGPSFLKKPENEWPENRFQPDACAKCESKVKSDDEHSFLTVDSEDANVKNPSFRLLPERFSNWRHYTRVCAWTNRFIENCRLPKTERNVSKELNISEIQNAEQKIIRSVQAQVFKQEYDCLVKKRNIPSASKLLQLNPMLDEDGVMRSNSRFRYIEHLSYECKHPIILPRKNPVTKLIVLYHHEKRHHSGTNQVLSSISAKYWILSAREAIREVENDCSACKRIKSKTVHQTMGPLPSFRAGTSMRAFSESAVDFTGPFLTKQGRGKPRNKRYMCLFTCMACRAIHIEMSYSLDTDSFLNALIRFVNRRGFPKLILSDNGTNFVGAVKELRELHSRLDIHRIERTAANAGIKWKFIPPLSPHFGGVHEAMIKSAKKALYAIPGNAEVTDEELLTAFSGAENLVNSRPLTYQSANPEDDCILTPNHFLFGQLGGEFAPENVDSETYNIRKRWRRVQELVKHFWARCHREFLPTLSSRRKWHKEHRDFQKDDVVMVIDPETARGNWNLGRIHEVHPGVDGRVRVATVKIRDKLQKRPTHRLCLIEKAQ